MNENVSKILEVNGYPTFNQVEDDCLRLRNQANIMVNIVEDLTIGGASKQECWDNVKAYITNTDKKYWPALWNYFIAAFSSRA
jgi:hypothetical protein